MFKYYFSRTVLTYIMKNKTMTVVGLREKPPIYCKPFDPFSDIVPELMDLSSVLSPGSSHAPPFVSPSLDKPVPLLGRLTFTPSGSRYSSALRVPIPCVSR